MRDHKSLQAWQEARIVVLGALTLVRDAWKPYASALFSQLQRASLSVQLNIRRRLCVREFSFVHAPLSVAYGSAVETGELLEIAIDAEIIDQQIGKQLLDNNQRSQRLLLGLLRSRKGKKPA